MMRSACMELSVVSPFSSIESSASRTSTILSEVAPGCGAEADSVETSTQTSTLRHRSPAASTDDFEELGHDRVRRLGSVGRRRLSLDDAVVKRPPLWSQKQSTWLQVRVDDVENVGREVEQPRERLETQLAVFDDLGA